MTVALSILYLASCMAMAKPLLRLLVGSDAADRPESALPWLAGWILCGFVAFFGGFFVTGLIDIVFGRHLVDLPHALPIVALATLALSWRYKSELSGSGKMPPPDLGPIGWTTLAAYLLLLLLTAQQFPRGFEVTAYHLASAANLLQTASIQPWDSHYPHTFPLNASLYFAFWLGLLPEKLAAASNFVFVALCGWAVYVLARQLGATGRAATIAACGLLSVPMLTFGAGELNADLGGIFFLGLALVFALAEGLPRRWLLAGLSMGLAFGFKSLHLLPLAFLGGWALLTAQFGAKPETRHSARLQGVLLFAIGAAATGGIWMLRNWLDFGNPFYPVNLPLIGKLAGWAVDPEVDFTARHQTQFEWVTDPAQWPLYPWFEWQQFGQHFKFDAGFGAFVAAALPLSLLATFTAAVRNGFVRCRLLLLPAACALFIIGAWWVLDDRQPRYMLGALLLLAPLSGWLLSAQPQPYRHRLEWLFGACIVIMLGIATTREVVKYGDRILWSKQTTRVAFYEYPPALDKLPAGTTILNLGARTWHYPLFGRQLQNRVISTPKARAMFGLPPNLGPIREVTLTTAPLLREKVDYVFSDGAIIHGDSCVRLQETYRQAFNPLNHVPLAKPRILYRVQYCSKPAQG